MSNDLIAVYSTMGFLVTINLGVCGYLWNTIARLQREWAGVIAEMQKEMSKQAVLVAERMVSRDEFREAMRDQTAQLIREIETKVGHPRTGKIWGAN